MPCTSGHHSVLADLVRRVGSAHVDATGLVPPGVRSTRSTRRRPTSPASPMPTWSSRTGSGSRNGSGPAPGQWLEGADRRARRGSRTAPRTSKVTDSTGPSTRTSRWMSPMPIRYTRRIGERPPRTTPRTRVRTKPAPRAMTSGSPRWTTGRATRSGRSRRSAGRRGLPRRVSVLREGLRPRDRGHGDRRSGPGPAPARSPTSSTRTGRPAQRRCSAKRSSTRARPDHRRGSRHHVVTTSTPTPSGTRPPTRTRG